MRFSDSDRNCSHSVNVITVGRYSRRENNVAQPNGGGRSEGE